ncbi:MAG: hypothetical protein Tp1111DCM1126091_23 [Prokaryotic dsDNA virus sp.]|nr:MAG: hypothetical protein Tp1111DCM1126091_23 [Prokaryotic dsDNA virus sp.]|tara:strand:- start:4262 stop:4681 length:420 start_codon:yes stop_codon:yes gene_type:complete
MKLSTVINNSNIPATLIRSVVRQCAPWDEFREIAQDVTSHGADSGFSGFIYYHETIDFTKRNRKYIIELLEEQSADFGIVSIYQFISEFNCLSRNYTPTEIAESFYRDNDARIAVFNALAWYALEEVSRAVVDTLESEE